MVGGGLGALLGPEGSGTVGVCLVLLVGPCGAPCWLGGGWGRCGLWWWS